MKRVIAAFLLSGVVACAQQVKLAWDYPGPITPATAFLVFAHTNTSALTNYTSALVNFSLGTNKSATISDLKPGRWWFFSVVNEAELLSPPSNLIGPFVVPPAPTNMHSILTQWSATLISTNWRDLGFFRVRIETQ